MDIPDNSVVLDLMLVIDGGYRNIMRCPVAAMIAVRQVFHFDDINGMRPCVALAGSLGASVGIELDDISCSAPIPQLIKPGLHATAHNFRFVGYTEVI